MIVSNYKEFAPVNHLLTWVDIPKSSFYYKATEGKRGAKPSISTTKQDGSVVNNLVVIEDIKEILSQEFCCYGYHNVTDVKQFLRAAEANQEFTHVATPDENSYIEAFHSIVQREVIDRFEFQSFYEAKSTLEAHRRWYNNRRKHKRLGMIPAKKWSQYFGGALIFNSIEFSGNAEKYQYDEIPKPKSYICLSTQTCNEENYKSISSF